MSRDTNPPPGTSSTPGDGTPQDQTLDPSLAFPLDPPPHVVTEPAAKDQAKPEPVPGGGPEVDGRVDEEGDDAPVYDDRGNVRPRGTKGARPMTFTERVALAQKQDRGGDVPPGGEPDVRKTVAAEAQGEKPQPRRRRRRSS